AAVEFGKRLAAAELKAAVAAKGLDLGDALDLIDATRFVGEDGDVDTAAIKSAVGKLAKLAPAPGPGPAAPSGGEFLGGTGAGTPITEQRLAQMSNDDIVMALDEGRRKHLM